METRANSSNPKPQAINQLLTSSEVELMETVNNALVFWRREFLLTSSEVELMETFLDVGNCYSLSGFWLPRKLN